MTWKPHATVACIVERDGRFLMVEEVDAGAAVFNQPAGHLEPDENLSAAAVREALEETGWHVQPKYLVGVYLWTHPDKGVTYLRFSFACDALEQDGARSLDDDIIAAHWMTREEIAACPQRSPLVLRCVDDYLAGDRMPLSGLHFVSG